MKKFKKKFFDLIFILSLVAFSNFNILKIQNSTIYNNYTNSSLKTSQIDNSNYAITQSVTYDVVINFTMTQTGPTPAFPDNHVYLKHPRFNDLEPNSSKSVDSGPFQISELLYSKITGSELTPYVENDELGNTFDLYNHTDIQQHDSITLNQYYDITLNEVTYGDLSSLPITMSDYNTSDDMFLFFCNQSDPDVYQTNNAELIAKSNEIAGSYSNPFDKAQAIINYVANHIRYTLLGGDEKGAYYAYDTGLGDCSEYSSLMITLLRIQGIPARKAGGFMIVSDMGYKPYIGQTWTFNFDDLLAHAWVEYYIPTVGWIQCEPQNPYFIKTSSYLRLTQTRGAWFDFPYWNDTTSTVEYDNLSEFTTLYTAYSSGLTYDYTITITVTDTNLLPGINWIVIIIIVTIIGVIIVVSIIVLRTIIHKRKYKSDW